MDYSQVERWLHELDTDDEDVIESEDDEVEPEPNLQALVRDSELQENEVERLSESDELSDSDNVPLSQLASGRRGPVYKSTNGTIWHKDIPSVTRTRTQNIRIRPPGPKGDAARSAKDPLSCFELFFTQDILEILVRCTNIYLDKIKDNFQRNRDAKPTDIVEMRAFLGLLYIMGVSRSGRRNIKDFWDNSQGTGLEIVYTTMSISRFRVLIRALRFDDITDREQRRELDKMAPIRQLVELVTNNCRNNYVPSDYLTLDEQLVGFRGRCGFIMYIPNKPDKFGIKIFMVVDTKFPYVYNFEIYVGAQPEGPFQKSNKVNDVVHRVLDPLYDLGCNVSMDNYFTNLPLAKELLQKKITIVGTMKANRPEIPKEFKASKSRNSKSSLFGFQKDVTLVSYVPKINKAVNLLSTMHYDAAIDPDTNEERKPEIITFYNRTKCGVDILDKMCKQYSVLRNSRRWPLTIFFDLMNIVGINALVINQMNALPEKIIRRKFLHELSFNLIKPHLIRRASIETLPRQLKFRIGALLGSTAQESQESQHDLTPKTGRVGRCALCSRARNRSTKKWCKTCYKWICPDHQAVVCPECYENKENSP